MSTFRRNFLFSALKPLLRDSTQCLEVDGILDLRAGGPHRPGTISSGLYRKGKTSAVGAMERKATTHVGSWLSLSCVPSPAKQVGTSRFRVEAMGNENSAPPAAGAWPDLQHKKRNATAELGRDRPGTETLGPLLKRKIKTAADQAASMLMPPPSSKCLYKHKATHQLGGDLLMNMAETAAPLLKWMQNGANEAAVRTMVPAPSSENLYKHEAMGQLGGDLLMNLDETSVPLLKWIKNDPDEAAVKTMVLPPSSENLLKHKATGQLGGTLFSKQTETAKPSLVKRIATAADEASAEAATKLLSAPPSGCLYKLKSKDQPGRNHPRTVPCELRPMINQMCPHEGSFTMHGNGKLMNTYTVYEVYVYKTQAITYLYGHDWRKFAFDYGLKKGDELRIRNSNGQIYLAGFNMIKAADPLTEQERMSQRATTPAPAPASHSPASAPVPVPAPFTASTQQSPTSALVPVEAPYTTHAQQAPASALVPLAAPFTAPAQQSPASAPVPLEAPFTAPAQQSPASAPARVPAQAHAPAPARSPRSQLIAVATRVVTRTHLKAMFKLPKSISKDLNAGRRGKISLVMESEGLTVEGRYSVSPTDGRLAVTSRWKKFIDGAKLRIGSKLKMEPNEPLNTKFYQLGNGGDLIFEHDLNAVSDFLERPHPEFHGIQVNDQVGGELQWIITADLRGKLEPPTSERILFSFRESNWLDGLARGLQEALARLCGQNVVRLLASRFAHLVRRDAMGVPMELQSHPQLRHHAEHLDYMLYHTQKELDNSRAYANQTHLALITHGDAIKMLSRDRNKLRLKCAKKDVTITRLRAQIASLESTVKAQEDQLREMEEDEAGIDLQGGGAYLSDDDDFEEDEFTEEEDYAFLEPGPDDVIPIDIEDEGSHT
ncbi:hypothetical protein QYE76_053100 [Lolium multiflorum]|uniref:Uncharacterized protein n=1 Tax=Lolium multiflorum TaxID=4521 RepID=A0AAD8SWK8_LOLMU|nr:hypothetical protein QYE76_053100 [Lolium multiflorum]